MSRHDLVFNNITEKWGEGAYTGNGLMGVMVYLNDDKTALRFRVGRSDVMIQERQAYRVPIGDLLLRPVGKITGGTMRMDLWNAEVTGTLKTDVGEIAFRTFTHASDNVQLIEIKPSNAEIACRWEFQPGQCANPRDLRDSNSNDAATRERALANIARDRSPAPEDVPFAQARPSGRQRVVRQKVYNGDEYATVWDEGESEGLRHVYLSVGHVLKGEGAIRQAQDALLGAMTKNTKRWIESHRDWWHKFYPASFVSIPDTRLESFYWIQLYKLASATRADRPAVDLMGPWYNDTPWPRIWWNLNIQLTYYPVYSSNHLELGESLCRMIDKGHENLSLNAGDFAQDSETVARTTGYNCRGSGGNELCNLPWAIHNYYMQYRYSMDDTMLRDRLFPRLKRSINYYLHHLKEDDAGKLHIIKGHSPEYPNQATPNPDCNIDLALLRWGCQALLDTCKRLKIDDPLIPKWEDTLRRLIPYPTNENGLMVSAGVPWKESHRHYSHLLMIYPLYIMNWDQPESRDMITRSLDHWLSIPSAFRGYSWTGASSICSMIGRKDDAVKHLMYFIDAKGRFGALPNTHYMEAGPVIETPLSAARSLQDILIQSWGNTIRVFPGVPDSWNDVTIDRMRTEGAFLVSAVRRNGKTLWIRIESLAGEPCRVKCDIDQPKADRNVAIKHLENGVIELDLKKGDSVILMPEGSGRMNLAVEAVEPQRDRTNSFGMR